MLSTTLKSVLEPQKQKSIREKEVKDKMVNVILEKIKNYSSYGQTNCTFKVPPFILGCIPYKHESMIKYLKSKFLKKDFTLKKKYLEFYTYLGILKISIKFRTLNGRKNLKKLI